MGLMLRFICIAILAAILPCAESSAPTGIDFARAQEIIGPSVVCVHARIVAKSHVDRQSDIERKAGSGSGFVVKTTAKDAFIVTNAHVILQEFTRESNRPAKLFDRVLISLPSGEYFDAEVVGFSVEADLAVLMAATPHLPVVTWADSNSARIGEWVMALGFPRGLGYSASVGIISATERSFGIYRKNDGIESFVQTDASINPGNSGGPLVNGQGAVLGVNAAIISESGGSEGLGFAISSNLAKRVIDEIIDVGQVRWAGVGIDIVELTAEQARDCGLPYAPILRAVRVSPTGPSGQAGLLPGSFINGLNSFKLKSVMQLRSRLAERKVGETVIMSVIDNGASKDVAVTLAPLAGSKEQLSVDDLIVLPELGIAVYWSGAAGVVVGDVSAGKAAEWGVLPGDIVVVPDSRGTSADLIMLRRNHGAGAPRLTIKRNGRTIQLPTARAPGAPAQVTEEQPRR